MKASYLRTSASIGGYFALAYILLMCVDRGGERASVCSTSPQ